MGRKGPLNPSHPERICWGCDQYCGADALRCGNGTDRTQHPIASFGSGWQDVGLAPLVDPTCRDAAAELSTESVDNPVDDRRGSGVNA
jgi:hypothetical protein